MNFRAKRFSFRPGIDIGLQLEVVIKNDKHRFGFEWASDGCGTMSKTTIFGTTNTFGSPEPLLYKTYSNSTGYFQTGFKYNRFSLRYQRRLTSMESAMRVFIIPEVTLIKGEGNRAEWIYENDSISNNSILFHNNSKIEATKISANYWGGSALLFGLGFKTDFYTPKSKKYLFSLDLSCRLGYKAIGGSQHKTIINDSGEVFALNYELATSGSGLYLQLSRSFKLFNSDKVKKKKSP